MLSNKAEIPTRWLLGVLRVLEAEGIARIAQRMYPVANIKGTD